MSPECYVIQYPGAFFFSFFFFLFFFLKFISLFIIYFIYLFIFYVQHLARSLLATKFVDAYNKIETNEQQQIKTNNKEKQTLKQNERLFIRTSAYVRSNPLCQATKRQLNNS